MRATTKARATWTSQSSTRKWMKQKTSPRMTNITKWKMTNYMTMRTKLSIQEMAPQRLFITAQVLAQAAEITTSVNPHDKPATLLNDPTTSPLSTGRVGHLINDNDKDQDKASIYCQQISHNGGN